MDEKINSLISMIYDTAVLENGWLELLSRMAIEFDGVGATYFVLDKTTRQPYVWCNVGHDITTESTYTNHYINVDPTLELALRSGVGAVLNSANAFSDRYVNGSEYFQDFLLPRRLGNIVGAKLFENNQFVSMFSVQQHLTARLTSNKNNDLLDEISPHLTRAAEINWRLNSLDLWGKTVEAALSKSRQATFVVDARNCVRYLNAAAELAISSLRGIAIRGHWLHCVDARQDAELKSAVAHATAATCAEVGHVSINYRDAQLFLSVVPVEIGCDLSMGYGRCALIIVSPAMPAEAAFSSLMAHVFCLTKAETVLAYRLSCGSTLTEIAFSLQLSKETLRSQLQSIFAKTGTKRQGQLINVMQQLANCLPMGSSQRN